MPHKRRKAWKIERRLNSAKRKHPVTTKAMEEAGVAAGTSGAVAISCKIVAEERRIPSFFAFGAGSEERDGVFEEMAAETYGREDTVIPEPESQNEGKVKLLAAAYNSGTQAPKKQMPFTPNSSASCPNESLRVKNGNIKIRFGVHAMTQTTPMKEDSQKDKSVAELTIVSSTPNNKNLEDSRRYRSLIAPSPWGGFSRDGFGDVSAIDPKGEEKTEIIEGLVADCGTNTEIDPDLTQPCEPFMLKNCMESGDTVPRFKPRKTPKSGKSGLSLELGGGDAKPNDLNKNDGSTPGVNLKGGKNIGSDIGVKEDPTLASGSGTQQPESPKNDLSKTFPVEVSSVRWSEYAQLFDDESLTGNTKYERNVPVKADKNIPVAPQPVKEDKKVAAKVSPNTSMQPLIPVEPDSLESVELGEEVSGGVEGSNPGTEKKKSVGLKGRIANFFAKHFRRH